MHIAGLQQMLDLSRIIETASKKPENVQKSPLVDTRIVSKVTDKFLLSFSEPRPLFPNKPRRMLDYLKIVL